MFFVFAVVLVIAGLVQLLQGQIIFGLLLLIAACILGPGGSSVLSRRGEV